MKSRLKAEISFFFFCKSEARHIWIFKEIEEKFYWFIYYYSLQLYKSGKYKFKESRCISF